MLNEEEINNLKKENPICWECKMSKTDWIYFELSKDDGMLKILTVICQDCRDCCEATIKGMAAGFRGEKIE